MKKSSASNPPNPAQTRDDIQAGLAGYKRPGFDPALVPLETDAKAAGTPMSAEQIGSARQTQRQGEPTPAFRDDGSAMRPIFPESQPIRARIPHSVILLGLFGVALFVVAVLAALRL